MHFAYVEITLDGDKHQGLCADSTGSHCQESVDLAHNITKGVLIKLRSYESEWHDIGHNYQVCYSEIDQESIASHPESLVEADGANYEDISNHSCSGNDGQNYEGCNVEHGDLWLDRLQY